MMKVISIGSTAFERASRSAASEPQSLNAVSNSSGARPNVPMSDTVVTGTVSWEYFGGVEENSEVLKVNPPYR